MSMTVRSESSGEAAAFDVCLTAIWLPYLIEVKQQAAEEDISSVQGSLDLLAFCCQVPVTED